MSINNFEVINDGTNSSANLYLIDGLLYKVFYDNAFIVEKMRNLTFLIKEKPIKPNAIDLLESDGELVGYIQEFIPCAKTFKEGIDDSNYELKYKAVLDVFKSIKKIHSLGYVIGDVHSKNFIYNYDGGYLIDLDEIRIPEEDDWKFRDYYLVKKNNRTPNIKKESFYTDNVKATISSLSLLLGFDLEEVVRDESLETLKIYIDWLINDDELKNQIFEIFDRSDQVIYFDEILESKAKLFMKDK